MVEKKMPLTSLLIGAIIHILGRYTSVTFAFNIEDRLPIVKIGPDGSLFGLSIAQHHIHANSKEAKNAVLLVGAPTDERAPEHGADITKPGGFYRCAISLDKNCNRVVVTPKVTHRRTNSSNQWLGVSVKSHKPGGKIAVCAHRYTLRGGARPSLAWEAVIGRCFILEHDVVPVKDQLSFEYVPCLGKQDDKGAYTHKGFGYCQAGTAVNFADVPGNRKVEEFILFGAPGSFIWSGALYASQLNRDVYDVSAENIWSHEEPEVNSPIRNNSLLGSSLTSGPLLNKTVNYVAGAPSANVTGAVAIFEKVTIGGEAKLDIAEIVYGDKIASRFGHDVQLVDVTGDGRLDLIVGAPQYYDREQKFGGAVYLYVNKGLGQIGPNPTQKLFGNIDSSFGMSIVGLGDINMDGADDIAIGAPGEGSWQGAIYIFHGDNGRTSKGVDEKPAQVIRAAELRSLGYLKSNITGMGYSLSGGLDMDFNGYPDIAAGSLSDTVVMFQSRPIVNIIGRIMAPDKQITISDSTDKEGYDITICLKYTSTPTTFDEEVKVTCTVILDSARLKKTGLYARASFSSVDPSIPVKRVNMTLHKQSKTKEKCRILKIYIRDDLQDKLSPIELELAFTTPNIMQKRKRRAAEISPPTPIMNAGIDNIATAEIQFSKDCGDDDICKSQLYISAFYEVLRAKTWEKLEEKEGNVTVLKLGTEKKIGMIIDVKNPLPGEDAHQARLRIQLPSVLQYIGIDKLSESGADLHCQPDTDNETLIICDLGNPFESQSSLQFRLKLSKNAEAIYKATGFDIKLQLQTTSQQPHHDDVHTYPVIVRVEAQLEISGYPSKEQVRFGGVIVGESAIKHPADAGNLHSHSYEVINTGTGPAENVSLHIKWPQNIINGKWLFYLLEANVHDGGNCTLPHDVNPLGLKYMPTRVKRVAVDEDVHVLKGSVKAPESSYEELTCSNSASCIEFECSLGRLEPQDIRYIELHAVLWNSTFLEEYRGVSQIKVQSTARVTVMQRNIKFSAISRLNYTVSTSVLSEVLIPPIQDVNWWIIVAASVAGLVLLIFLVFILWKCGFFKRRKFGDFQKARRHKQASKKADERQTLY